MSVPTFGRAPDGVAIVPRPSAYAVVRDAAGRVAVVRTPKGLFLPGGGREEGESPEETIVREAREECGLVIEPAGRIGAANEIVYEKQGVFVAARPTGPPAGGGEPDHALEWLAPTEAARTLTHASHRWAVGRSP
jgi:8-oxo-dGTP diphosphatase